MDIYIGHDLGLTSVMHFMYCFYPRFSSGNILFMWPKLELASIFEFCWSHCDGWILSVELLSFVPSRSLLLLDWGLSTSIRWAGDPQYSMLIGLLRWFVRFINDDNMDSKSVLLASLWLLFIDPLWIPWMFS